VIRNEQKKEKF